MKTIDEAVWHNVEDLLKRKGVSYAELARSLGMAQSNLSNYRKGKLGTGKRLILRLAKALDVTPDALLVTPEALHGGVMIARDVVESYPKTKELVTLLNDKAKQGMTPVELIEWLIHLLEAELVLEKSRNRVKPKPKGVNLKRA